MCAWPHGYLAWRIFCALVLEFVSHEGFPIVITSIMPRPRVFPYCRCFGVVSFVFLVNLCVMITGRYDFFSSFNFTRRMGPAYAQTYKNTTLTHTAVSVQLMKKFCKTPSNMVWKDYCLLKRLFGKSIHASFMLIVIFIHSFIRILFIYLFIYLLIWLVN